MSRLDALPVEERIAAYDLFLAHLTVTGRMVGYGDDLTMEEKVEGLKAINEVNHRCFNHLIGLRRGDNDYSEEEFAGVIWANVKGSAFVAMWAVRDMEDAVGFVTRE